MLLCDLTSMFIATRAKDITRREIRKAIPVIIRSKVVKSCPILPNLRKTPPREMKFGRERESGRVIMRGMANIDINLILLR